MTPVLDQVLRVEVLDLVTFRDLGPAICATRPDGSIDVEGADVRDPRALDRLAIAFSSGRSVALWFSDPAGPEYLAAGQLLVDRFTQTADASFEARFIPERNSAAMETPSDDIDRARLEFAIPADEGGGPGWQDVGECVLETSIGRGHGAMTVKGPPIGGAAIRELERFRDGVLTWRVTRRDVAPFVGTFAIAEGSLYYGPTGFGVALVATAPVGQEKPEAEDDGIDESPGTIDLLEAIAGEANTLVATGLRDLLAARNPSLAFGDAFSAVTAGALDAIVRLVVSVLPSERLNYDTVAGGLAAIVQEVGPGVIAERLSSELTAKAEGSSDDR